jgi:hypothetical protein
MFEKLVPSLWFHPVLLYSTYIPFFSMLTPFSLLAMGLTSERENPMLKIGQLPDGV